jgi:hypothetical protein
VLGHFLASVPGQRASELGGQRRDRGCERVLHGDGAAVGESRPVLRSRDDAVTVLAWQVDQHREPRGALDQRADRGALKIDDQITFPVPGNRSVLDLSGAFARCVDTRPVLVEALRGIRRRGLDRSPRG